MRAKQQELVDLVKGPKGDLVSDAELTRIAAATQSLSETQLDKLLERMKQLLQNKEGLEQSAVVTIETEAARIVKGEAPPAARSDTSARREPTAEEIKTIKKYYQALKTEIKSAEMTLRITHVTDRRSLSEVQVGDKGSGVFFTFVLDDQKKATYVGCVVSVKSTAQKKGNVRTFQVTSATEYIDMQGTILPGLRSPTGEQIDVKPLPKKKK
jgi:hypothetical protein